VDPGLLCSLLKLMKIFSRNLLHNFLRERTEAKDLIQSA
jgi:hypothetical protein